MKKDIKNVNAKFQLHGYQEGYLNDISYRSIFNEISYRSIYKNNQHVGYCEWHGIEETIFYIR
jgi:hypothetical protein